MKVNYIYILLLIFLSFPKWGFSQVPPVISEVRPEVAYPGQEVEIIGSGFSTNPSELSVWFGGVEGEILSSLETVIQVKVPANAEAGVVTVINKVNRQSAKSSSLFFTNFSGTGFSENNFTSAFTYTNNLQFFDLCVCDFNMDGKADIAISELDGATNSVKLFTNQSTPGNINFVESADPIVLAPTADLKCADLNADGFPDLIATKGGIGGVDRNAVYYFQNNSGTLAQAQALLLPVAEATTENVEIKDLNFDGKPDLIVSNSKTNIIYAFENTSTTGISFNTTPLKITLQGRDATRGLSLKDLNSDGRPDIIVAAQSGLTSDIVVLPNNSTENTLDFREPIVYPIGEVLQGDVIAADFNGDGLLDLAASSPFSNKLIVLTNASSGETIDFNGRTDESIGGVFGLDIADVNGDGKIDIVGSDTKTGSINILLNESTETVSFNSRVFSTAYPTRNVAANDFDGDGKPDIAFTAQGNNEYYFEIYRNSNCYKPVLLSDSPQKICPTQTKPVIVAESPGSTYTWFANGVEAGTTTEPVFQNTGVNTITVSVTQENGACVNTSDNSVVFEDASGTVPGQPVANNTGPACLGDEITLIASNIDGASYSWTGPNGFSSSDQNPILSNVTAETAGIYSLTVSLGECQSSVVTTVAEVFTFPTLVIESSKGDGFCEGDINTLSVPALQGFTFEWFTENLSLGTGPTLDITTAGSYGVKVTQTALGCETDIRPITVETTTLPQVSFEASKTTICAGEPVALTNNTVFDNSQNINYTWDFGDGNTSLESNPSHIFGALGSYTITLNANYDGFDDCGGSSTLSVTVTDAVVPTISATETSICEGEEETTLTLNGSYTDISWNTGSTETSITVNNSGIYTVDTQDANGCPGQAEITIEALISPEVTAEKDTTVFLGDTVRLFASGADSYEWSVAEGPGGTIDDPTSANPLIQTGESSLFEVIGYSTDLCTDTAYVAVTIERSGVINVQPNALLSPATVDGINDTWIINNIQWYSDCTVTILDRRGAPVFEASGYNNQWDGTRNGSELPAGIYYYIITCPNSPDLVPKKGTILLVK